MSVENQRLEPNLDNDATVIPEGEKFYESPEQQEAAIGQEELEQDTQAGQIMTDGPPEIQQVIEAANKELQNYQERIKAATTPEDFSALATELNAMNPAELQQFLDAQRESVLEGKATAAAEREQLLTSFEQQVVEGRANSKDRIADLKKQVAEQGASSEKIRQQQMTELQKMAEETQTKTEGSEVPDEQDSAEFDRLLEHNMDEHNSSLAESMLAKIDEQKDNQAQSRQELELSKEQIRAEAKAEAEGKTEATTKLNQEWDNLSADERHELAAKAFGEERADSFLEGMTKFRELQNKEKQEQESIPETIAAPEPLDVAGVVDENADWEALSTAGGTIEEQVSRQEQPTQPNSDTEALDELEASLETAEKDRKDQLMANQIDEERQLADNIAAAAKENDKQRAFLESLQAGNRKIMKEGGILTDEDIDRIQGAEGPAELAAIMQELEPRRQEADAAEKADREKKQAIFGRSESTDDEFNQAMKEMMDMDSEAIAEEQADKQHFDSSTDKEIEDEVDMAFDNIMIKPEDEPTEDIDIEVDEYGDEIVNGEVIREIPLSKAEVEKSMPDKIADKIVDKIDKQQRINSLVSGKGGKLGGGWSGSGGGGGGGGGGKKKPGALREFFGTLWKEAKGLGDDLKKLFKL